MIGTQLCVPSSTSIETSDPEDIRHLFPEELLTYLDGRAISTLGRVQCLPLKTFLSSRVFHNKPICHLIYLSSWYEKLKSKKCLLTYLAP
jgi:hypothetical protein